tara:strand:- start:2489 stop:2851 length:363 start_codon:yes stop_codon:yes gene_type:complete
MIAKLKQLLNFDNLAFHKHPSCDKAVMAQLNMGDITISVVANTLDGNSLYGHVDDDEYEVAMWKKGDSDMIPLGAGDDVLAGQSPAQVSKHMRDAQIDGDAWVDLLRKLRKDFRDELNLD